MASGTLSHYLGKGEAADRPASRDLSSNAFGWWLNTDTGAVDIWGGADWIENVLDTGAAISDETTIITEASAFAVTKVTHSGRSRLILAGGSPTFSTAASFVAGNTFNIRATGSITLIEDGVTLTPEYGGTKTLLAGMTVSVVMTGATTGIIMGHTEAAP